MRPGDEVPDFELVADKGQSVGLYDELGEGPVVLFFYPKAMTPGCTAESCHFRDLGAEFGALGARRLGLEIRSRLLRFAARWRTFLPRARLALSASARRVQLARLVQRRPLSSVRRQRREVQLALGPASM